MEATDTYVWRLVYIYDHARLLIVIPQTSLTVCARY